MVYNIIHYIICFTYSHKRKLERTEEITEKGFAAHLAKIENTYVNEKSRTTVISKKALMDVVGVSSQSIHTCRTNYKNGGIDFLTAHNWKAIKLFLQ